MKLYLRKFILPLMAVGLIVTGCSSPQTEPNPAKPAGSEGTTTPIEHKATTEKPTFIIDRGQTETGQGTEITGKALPFSLNTYTLSHADLTWAMAAPEFVNQNVIAFSMDDSVRARSSVGLFDRDQQTYQNIYTADQQVVINTLVGHGNRLYWVEHSRNPQTELNWKIIKYDLESKQTAVLREGVSLDQTSPPILRVADGVLTWIEYKFSDSNKTVTSRLYTMDTETDKISERASAQLDESKEREGTFFALQNPVKDGVLIHQTMFIPDQNGGEAEKTYQIVYYPYDDPKPVYLIEGSQVLDFTLSDDWFVWTEEGQINVASIEKGEVLYRFKGKSERLTLDSPFIRDHYLFYRYGVNQIWMVDLQTGGRMAVTPDQVMTSKLFTSGGRLSFGVSQHNDVKGSATFYVVE